MTPSAPRPQAPGGNPVWSPPAPEHSDTRPPQPASPSQHPGPTAPAGLVRPTRPSVTDIILAGAALLVLGPLTFAGVSPEAGAVGTAAGMVASITMPAAIAWRRSHPAASAVVVYLAALLHFATGTPIMPADVLIFVSLYSVTVYGPRWARLAGLGGALLGCLLQALSTMTFAGSLDWNSLETQDLIAGGLSFAMPAALVLAVWALGLVRKARVERLEAFAERAQRLEIERDQQAQIATAAERARIAREMHDVVAHSLSVVISQADGGRYAAATNPQAAQEALTTIAASARTALADLRRILGVLRDQDDRRADGTGPTLAPQPTSADLQALLPPVRQGGLEVSLRQWGTVRTLPAPTGLSVYRIVQESLTNVLKHAGPAAQADVDLTWHHDYLELTIADTGRGAAAAPGSHSQHGAGHGLVGMGERATMVGGTVTAGPRPGGGWLVQATIPVPPVADASAAVPPVTDPQDGEQ